MIVYRTLGDDLEIELTSDEELGILDTDYIEDFAGVDGQVSLHHTTSDVRYPLVMLEVVGADPGIDHDFFLGSTPIAGLPDGEYTVEGRVRDTLGNYTILTAFGAPVGGERVVTLEFEIRDGLPFPPTGARVHRTAESPLFEPAKSPLFLLPERELVRI